MMNEVDGKICAETATGDDCNFSDCLKLCFSTHKGVSVGFCTGNIFTGPYVCTCFNNCNS